MLTEPEPDAEERPTQQAVAVPCLHPHWFHKGWRTGMTSSYSAGPSRLRAEGTSGATGGEPVGMPPRRPGTELSPSPELGFPMQGTIGFIGVSVIRGLGHDLTPDPGGGRTGGIPLAGGEWVGTCRVQIFRPPGVAGFEASGRVPTGSGVLEGQWGSGNSGRAVGARRPLGRRLPVGGLGGRLAGRLADLPA